ncbi:hypothetical protein ACH5RR_041055 [Cinchona calisaya]|uniref:Uncharacterized protein n=1 Tax=Cinchona calisaya TaxID=153742 RepID=A0ABD2XTY2_9GENT
MLDESYRRGRVFGITGLLAHLLVSCVGHYFFRAKMFVDLDKTIAKEIVAATSRSKGGQSKALINPKPVEQQVKELLATSPNLGKLHWVPKELSHHEVANPRVSTSSSGLVQDEKPSIPIHPEVMHTLNEGLSIPPNNVVNELGDDHYVKFRILKSKKPIMVANIIDSLSNSDTVEREFQPRVVLNSVLDDIFSWLSNLVSGFFCAKTISLLAHVVRKLFFYGCGCCRLEDSYHGRWYARKLKDWNGNIGTQ